MQNERRRGHRVVTLTSIELKIDSQITLQGSIKNITDKGAFIQIKSSVFLKVNDQFEFLIPEVKGDVDKSITGTACISRIESGVGIGVYFTNLDEEAELNLKLLLE